MKKVISLCIVLLFLISCEEDSFMVEDSISETNIVGRLKNFVPDDIKIITLAEWEEELYRNNTDDKFMLATESKRDFVDQDLLKKVLPKTPIAYIGNALDDEISRFTGASTIKENLYITHVNPESGIVTNIFPINDDSSEEGSKNVFIKEVGTTKEEKEIFRTKILDYAKNELSLNDNELDSLKLELDDFINYNHSHKSIERKNSTIFNKEDLSYIKTEISNIYNELPQHKKSSTDKQKSASASLADYALRTVIKYRNLADYKYKHIFRFARGIRQGGVERFYVETIHESGVGVQYLASLFPYTSKRYGLGCMLHQYLDDVLHKIELESYAEKDFFLEAYSPSQGSGDGNATYSGAQNFGIKLKPLKPSELVELSFNMGHSYSYTLPDIRFYVEHTSNNAENDYYDSFRLDNPQKLNFTFNLERAIGGEFGDFAEGLHRSGYITGDLFVDESQWPIFLKSAMKIDANVIYSAPTSDFSTYDSRKKWFYTSANIHKHKWVSARAWKAFCWFAAFAETHQRLDGDSSYFNGVRLNLNSLL